jgi:hypothetical protein
MERETRNLVTPNGKELVLKTYLTARERNQLRDVFLKNAKVPINSDGLATNEGMTVDASIITESQNVLLKIVVVKYGDVTESDAILNMLLDNDPIEYDYVAEEAGKVNGNFTQAK